MFRLEGVLVRGKLALVVGTDPRKMDHDVVPHARDIGGKEESTEAQSASEQAGSEAAVMKRVSDALRKSPKRDGERLTRRSGGAA